MEELTNRPNMTELNAQLATTLASRFDAHLTRIRELALPLSEQQFWAKPYPYGNSFGHLVLHLTGNLNYYIGAQIANSGYVRDREREFTECKPPSKQEAISRLGEAVAMVIQVVRAQSSDEWSSAYSATGTTCNSRLEIVIHCAAHMQHHIGQMLYLCQEWKRRDEATSPERSVT